MFPASHLLVALLMTGALAAGEPLRVGLDLWAGYYPALIADERGLFRAEGLDVRIDLPQDTGRMLAEFAAGSYDLVGVSLGDLVTVAAHRPGTRLILASDQSAGADVLLGRGAAPPADGVIRIGTRLGGFGELLVQRYAVQAGIPAARIRLMQVDASDAPGLLARGEVDAVHTWQPYAAAAIAAGATTWFDSSRTPLLITDGIAARPTVADGRRAELAAFCRAWFQATAWWQQHPDAARALLMRRLHADAAAVASDGIQLFSLDDNRRLLTSGAVREIAAIHVAHHVRRGMLVTAPDAAALLDPSYLPTP